MAGQQGGRALFTNSTGEVAPIWDRALGFASVGLILLALPFALRQAWQRHRDAALAMALAVGALAYPVSLALRMTAAGAEVSSRSSEFVFLALAFVLGVGAIECWPTYHRPWRRYAIGIAATVIFAGGVIVGGPAWARLPGAYLVAADARSIEPESVSAAVWARSVLGAGNRFATDRVNRLLMGSYGEQRVVTAYGDRVDVPRLFFAPQVGGGERDVLRLGNIRYVLVDRRLSTASPLVGAYFDLGECHERCAYPVAPESLDKFDHLDQVARVFDSGDIAIYDVASLVTPVSPNTGWQTWYQDPHGSAWPSSDGGYHLLVQQPERFVAVSAPLPGPVSDVVVRATFRKLSGPAGSGYGVIVRDQQAGPRTSGSQTGWFYLVEVSDAGGVGMWRREGSRWRDLQPWTATSAVRPGEAANQLEVEARGPLLSVRVNRMKVTEWSRAQVRPGGVGVFVDGAAGSEVRLEDFSVQTPG
jgi:hypothetical protein